MEEKYKNYFKEHHEAYEEYNTRIWCDDDLESPDYVNKLTGR